MKDPAIKNIEVFPVRVPITRTFNFASGSAEEQGEYAQFVFVKATGSEECSGWGEGRAHPRSYETPAALNGSQFMDDSLLFLTKLGSKKVA